MSATANFADPRLQDRIAERYRQLRSKVDRARAVYEQHQKGELTALNAEQKKIVHEYPHWLEDLEELRQGRLPAPRTAAAAAQAEQASAIPGLAPAVSKSKKRGKRGGGDNTESNNNNGNGHHHHDNGAPPASNEEEEVREEESEAGGKAPRPANKKGDKRRTASAHEEPPEEEGGEEGADAGEITSEEDLLATLQAVCVRDVQEELIHAYVDRYMAHQSDAKRELTEVEKKLSSAEGLKKKIISGAVKVPSKAQLSVIEQLPSLRKQVAAARKKVKKEDRQMREDLVAKLDAMGSGPDHGAEEEAEGEDDQANDEDAAEDAAVTPEVRAPANTAEDTTLPPAPEEEDNPWVAAEPATDHPVHDAAAEAPESAEEGAPTAEAAEVAEPQHKTKEKEEAEAKEPSEAAPQGEEEEEEAEDAVREPTPPSPPPPVNITFTPGTDWSKLVYSKAEASSYTLSAFEELAGPACRREVETAAAAAAAHASSSSPSPPAQKEREESDEAPASHTGAVTPYAVDNTAHHVRQHIRIGHMDGAAPLGATAAPPHADTGLDEEAAATGLPASWLARIQLEFAQLQQHPIPRVLVHKTHPRPRPATENGGGEERKWLGARPPEEVQWHVDVSPADGPLAGEQVHLVVAFPPAYPFVPPVVHCPVAMPHKGFMVSQAGQANTLFITYREHYHLLREKAFAGSAKGQGTATSAAAAIATGGWLPDMGARTVVQELQNFFNEESFAPTAQALGTEAFAQEMGRARVALGLHRAKCTTCDGSRGGDVCCVNGPFFIPPPRSSGELEEEEEEEQEGDAEVDDHGAGSAAPQRRRGRGRGGPKALFGSGAIAMRDGAIQGPFLGCWANLLYTEKRTAQDEGGVGRMGCLHLASTGADRWPSVEVYQAPSSLVAASAQKDRGGGSSLATWAGSLLSSLSANEAKEKPVWSLPAGAFARSGGSSGGLSCATVRFVSECDQEAIHPTAADAAAVVAALPTPAKGHAVFAIVVRVPGKDQSVSVTFSTTTTTAAFPSAEGTSPSTSSDTSEPDFLALWPHAEALVQGCSPCAKAAQTTGIFVGIPFGFAGDSGSVEEYLGDAGGGGARVRGDDGDPVAAAVRQEGYYIPRRVVFHLKEGRAPVVASADAFFHYKALIASTRRSRPRPGAAVVGPEESFLAVAPEDIVRRHILGDKGPASGGGGGGGVDKPQRSTFSRNGAAGGQLSSTHAVATLSDYFLGLRTLFLPCAPCSPEDLAKFKNTCMRLYRNPQASTQYTIPFRPICALHLLSLVLRHAAEVALSGASATEEGEKVPQLAKAVIREVFALSRQLAASDAAYKALCESLTKGDTPAAVGGSDTRLLLFQTTPFIPLYVFEWSSENGGSSSTEAVEKDPARSNSSSNRVRERALKDLGYAMGAATQSDAAAYEAESEVLGHLVAAGTCGQAPPFDHVASAAATAAGASAKKAKRWADACNAASATAEVCVHESG